ncbi:MAG TPA: hypothetical protein VIE65_21915 [Methylobacter sp.]|jgi:hypothetical protein
MTKPLFDFTKFINDKNLLGWSYDDPSYDNWKIIERGALGEGAGFTIAERIKWRELTGCDPPTEPVEEFIGLCGRRCGKGRAGAALTLYFATCFDYHSRLAPGERAIIPHMAPTQVQAGRVWLMSNGLIEGTPMLKPMVQRRTADTIEFDTGADLVIQAANFRSVRGASSPLVVIDELAYLMPSESGAAMSDTELLNALSPSLSNLNGMMVCLTTLGGKRGEAYARDQKYGDNHDPKILVIRQPTRVMNPSLPQKVVDRAFERDAIIAAAEFGSIEGGLQFRPDLAGYIDRDKILGLVSPGLDEIPPWPGTTYFGFCDPSGGSGQDSFVLAISHARDDGVTVLDKIVEHRPPFNPSDVVKSLAEVCKAYSVGRIQSDRYAGAWPEEQWKLNNIYCDFSELSKSEIYVQVLPQFNTGNIRLLDNKRLVAQLSSLERRTARGTGRDVVDHPTGGHDDVANSACGALLAATQYNSVLKQWENWAHVPLPNEYRGTGTMFRPGW